MFTETTPLAPNSPYSASKASSDLMVRAYHETYGMPVNITRCSNNYCPYQFPEKLIPLMINNCRNEKPLPLYGDGMQVRDWLHVSDHCSAIDTVLHKGVSSEVYNIGGNNEKANIEIVKLTIKTFGKSEDLIQYVIGRQGHDRRYAIDNTKITSQLGWSPAYTFEQGMAETIQWYLAHQEWMDRVVSIKSTTRICIQGSAVLHDQPAWARSVFNEVHFAPLPENLPIEQLIVLAVGEQSDIK